MDSWDEGRPWTETEWDKVVSSLRGQHSKKSLRRIWEQYRHPSSLDRTQLHVGILQSVLQPLSFELMQHRTPIDVFLFILTKLFPQTCRWLRCDDALSRNLDKCVMYREHGSSRGSSTFFIGISHLCILMFLQKHGLTSNQMADSLDSDEEEGETPILVLKHISLLLDADRERFKFMSDETNTSFKRFVSCQFWSPGSSTSRYPVLTSRHQLYDSDLSPLLDLFFGQNKSGKGRDDLHLQKHSKREEILRILEQFSKNIPR